jgi:hypothetical protein
MAHPTLQRRVAADLTAAVNLTPAAANPMPPTTKLVAAESGRLQKWQSIRLPPLLDDFVLDDPYPF